LGQTSEKVIMNRSYKVEVIADNSGKWCSNQRRFPLTDHGKMLAVAAGTRIAMAWTLVRDWRVAEAEEEPNEVSNGT